ncbi:hypothetical protein FACS1894178_1460 [Bacteroidia bacterium]|nr:hypothetical protein FACS1894178_1460 [Bacteroidia bacterium]
MKKITKILAISALVLALATIFSSCNKGNTLDGYVNMKITGAPASPTFAAAYLIDSPIESLLDWNYNYPIGASFYNGNSGETSGFRYANSSGDGWWHGGGSYYVLIMSSTATKYYISDSKISFTTGTKTVAWSNFHEITSIF